MLREQLLNSDNSGQIKFAELLSAEEALTKLKSPLTEVYSNELEFDKALFQALRDCLKEYDLRPQDDKTIFLDLGQKNEYAVGIVRQNSPAINLVQNKMLTDSFEHTNTETDVDTVLGHGVCLFQKRENKWHATDCFSLVELKMSDSSCEDFDLNDSNSKIERPELGGRHGPLGQLILKNLGTVLPHRAKRGVLGDHIPLAMIAGIREGSERALPQKPLLRWVSGRLEVPEACGTSFYYDIQDFGQFANDDMDLSVELALSVYIETILFGLVAAIDVQRTLAASRTPLAVPASGQSLMIGQARLNLQLCAIPIQGAVTSEVPYEIDKWSVSQGDLFKGSVDVSEVLQIAGVPHVDFCRGRNKKIGACPVLVKVSSTAVHNLFLPPGIAYTALERVSLGRKALVNEIGTVLYAVVETDAGLVTIMGDLTKQGYGTLQPIKSGDQLAVLWGGFQELVERVLLPMAEIGVVHADVRPGYDITSNVLCKLHRGKGGVQKATMKLIDFESLVRYQQWNMVDMNGRYTEQDPEWDATTYVWWQCMAVAFAWKEALNVNSLLMGDALAEIRLASLDDLSVPAKPPRWLDKYQDRAKSKINGATLKMTVRELAEEFSMIPQHGSMQKLL